MSERLWLTIKVFLILLPAIALFTAWIVGLDMKAVHAWAVAATIAALLAVAVAIMRGRR